MGYHCNLDFVVLDITNNNDRVSPFLPGPTRDLFHYFFALAQDLSKFFAKIRTGVAFGSIGSGGFKCLSSANLTSPFFTTGAANTRATTEKMTKRLK